MNVDRILDLMYDSIDDLLLDGKYEEVDDILRTVNVENTNLVYLVGYLAITHYARNYLKYRCIFLLKCKLRYPDCKYKQFLGF